MYSLAKLLSLTIVVGLTAPKALADSFPPVVSDKSDCTSKNIIASAMRNLSDNLQSDLEFEPLLSTRQRLSMFKCVSKPVFDNIKVVGGRVTLTLHAKDESGRTSDLSLWFYAFHQRPVYVAKQAMRQGQEVTDESVVLEERRVLFDSREIMGKPPFGMLVDKDIRTGDVLRADDLSLKPIVKRGESVKVEMIGNGIRIVSLGRSDENIYQIDQLVSIRLNGSSESVKAKWLREGVAHVQL